MERVGAVLRDPLLNEVIAKLSGLEAEREFCRHTWDHLWSVARICYILLLESGSQELVQSRLGVTTLATAREVVYAAGLLHDLGREHTYVHGGDHAAVGAGMAEAVLLQAGYSQQERQLICRAIAEHRSLPANPSLLSFVLYQADKLSRPCRECSVRQHCHRGLPAAMPIY